MMKYQRNEGHDIAVQLRNLANVIEGCGSDLWVLANDLDIYVLDTMAHDEYMKAKKVLKKMIKMTRKVIKVMPSRTTYHNEMEENYNEKN